MPRSHSPPMPFALGVDERKLGTSAIHPHATRAVERGSPYLRNMFSDGGARLPPEDLYRGHPEDGGRPGVKTADLLERLTDYMKRKAANAFPHSIPDDNARIPAGYTYLAQMAAHDIVHNVAPLPSVGEDAGYLARDYRTERLVLDTIYGGGPAASLLPFALELNAYPDQRWLFRLGHVQAKTVPGQGHPPILTNRAPGDIARASCPHLSDSQRHRGLPDALLADPRNDDHLILSQLTVLFLELHNIVVDQILLHRGAPAVPDEFVAYRAFVEARKVVALAYRSIVVCNLLERLLNADVYGLYRQMWESGRYGLLDKEDLRVPVEFSHAAYRFGHVMVRDSYELNQEFTTGNEQSLDSILNFTSARMPQLMPVPVNWLIEWSRFFPPDAPNRSVSLMPYIGGSSHLYGNTFFPNPDKRRGGLFYRDLIRGAQAGMRSVDSLIRHICVAGRPSSELILNSEFRKKAILHWLARQSQALAADGHAVLSGEEHEHLAKDPPLFFFILFEAAHEERGERLGILGSTILAEVFFAALKSTAPSIEGDNAAVESMKIVFRDSPPKTMPDLIDFVSRSRTGLGRSSPCGPGS